MKPRSSTSFGEAYDILFIFIFVFTQAFDMIFTGNVS